MEKKESTQKEIYVQTDRDRKPDDRDTQTDRRVGICPALKLTMDRQKDRHRSG